ncbi:sporulation-specific protein 15-like isoform X2 [Dendronephthya gigantea]|uniref:sporulation-specific protein 15-like isoform X2 n=1 Tax=Dendronephthya gigantea TaxID=151771 RepID=UPI00106ABFAD|nr:sporulation-specific protein 15-like isoform X2 [Dendronephthya gigantea]
MNVFHEPRTESEEPSTPKTHPASSDREDTNNDILTPTAFPSVFSDSGIDVTEENKNENHLSTMNGLTAGHKNYEPLESINALRDTLRHLKQTTDKAVVRFLVRSRDVLREEVKSQNDIDRDEKLLGLISDLLRNKHETEKQLKELSCTNDDKNPLSELEKSLCYVLVDKALLNCLLVLDKALMEGKLTDCELNVQCGTTPSGPRLVSEFSQALNDKRQFLELNEELKRKDALVHKMRTQIRELSSEKLRLEGENKSLVEKSRLWQLKSEDEEMRNSVIDSDRQRLKEKVLFLEESMKGLQSSTEHLRQQLQTLEQEDDASRQENKLLKEKLHCYSEKAKQDGDRSRETGGENPSSSTTGGKLYDPNLTTDKMDSLLNENLKLRNRIETLEAGDCELREKLTSLTRAHKEGIRRKNDELQVLEEQNRTLQDDLDTRLTEIVLLKAQVVEMQKTGCSKHETHAVANQNGIAENLSSFNGILADRELQQIQELSHRAKTSEHRLEEYTALLEDLTKRKQILVNKLEMVGAVTVIKNECDVPDGYTEAIDGLLRSQSSLIEKGVLSILSEREEKENQRRSLEEENRRLRFTAEALETENLLLQVQVSDLTQTVEELEDDLIYTKCGGKPGKGKRPGTPGNSSGHRVTFDVETDKKEDEKLECLIQNAKQRCVNLEKQVRSNTSLLKSTQHKNENLIKDYEELRRENCNLRQYLDEGQRTNKILHIKIAELEERLQAVDDNKSLDEMEKQSLLDRLKIFEGQIKFLKVEKEAMRSRMNSLQYDSNSLDSKPRSPYSKFFLLEETPNEIPPKESGLVDEIERLKNKSKKQSARSRILQSEMFEFLDDIRCLESELGSVVDGFCPSDLGAAPQNGVKEEQGVMPLERGSPTLSRNTWGFEASLCQQNGMAPVMVEIVELLKSTVHRLQRISRSSSSASSEGVDCLDGRRDSNNRRGDITKQLSDNIAQLRKEKQVLQREVLALKAISESTLELQSAEDVRKANERNRTWDLRKQVLNSVQRNSELEGEILDYLTKKWALESELEELKERILNLKDERNILLSLGDGERSPCLGQTWGKSYEKGMRNFCFVKSGGSGFEVHDVLRIEPDLDNEDVFSCPSDEGVCHSPDREASSCDSGYHEEGHAGSVSDKGDSGLHCRFSTPFPTTRPLNVSYYDNSQGADKNVSEPLPMTTATEKKPKGILKKRNRKEHSECVSTKPAKLLVS